MRSRDAYWNIKSFKAYLSFTDKIPVLKFVQEKYCSVYVSELDRVHVDWEKSVETIHVFHISRFSSLTLCQRNLVWEILFLKRTKSWTELDIRDVRPTLFKQEFSWSTNSMYKYIETKYMFMSSFLGPQVHFEAVPAAKTSAAVAFKGNRARYRCAVTGDLLTNNSALVVLRTSGLVCTEEAFERLVRPEMRDPKSGAALKERDVIRLQRGSSGFAASGVQLQAKKETPVMQWRHHSWSPML